MKCNNRLHDKNCRFIRLVCVRIKRLQKKLKSKDLKGCVIKRLVKLQ